MNIKNKDPMRHYKERQSERFIVFLFLKNTLFILDRHNILWLK